MTNLVDSVQFKTGKQVEKFLDDYFEAEYFIQQTTPYEERTLCYGDRIYTGKANGQSFYVEYKSGIQTFYTGNLFLETISVDSANKPGWVYTCRADLIFYATLLNKKILIFEPARLRSEIEGLKARFGETKTKKNQNKGYNTHGVLVPLDYAEKYLVKTIIRLPG